MILPPSTARSTWRDEPVTRVAGSVVSWFLFSLNFSLLFLVGTTVMSLGGACASGGPYEIEVECPTNVAIFAPLSIFGGIFAVGLGLFLTRGFGPSLLDLAWPTLFCGLGSAFLYAFVTTGDYTGLVIGVVFVIMGLVPLVIALRLGWQSVFLGDATATGRPFEHGRDRPLRPSTARPGAEPVRASVLDWVSSLAILVGASYAGWVVAGLWFFAG